MPFKKGEAIPHYIELYEQGIPLSTGQKIKSRKQAIAIGLSEERKATKKKRKKKEKSMAKRRKRRKRRRNPVVSQYDAWADRSILGGLLSGRGAVDGAINWLKSPSDGLVGGLVLGVPKWVMLGVGVVAIAALYGSRSSAPQQVQPASVSGFGLNGFGPAPMGYRSHGINPVQGMGAYGQNAMYGPTYYAGQMFGR